MRKLAATVAADLYLLTAVLDEPEADLVDAVQSLATHAAALIPSYLGLGVTVTDAHPPLSFMHFEDGAEFSDVRASVGIALPGQDGLTVVFVLYASSPGTFTDLAADLAWLTDRPTADVTLDAHVGVLCADALSAPLQTESTVNQAIGIMMGHGWTPEQARQELDARASVQGADRGSIARGILGAIGRDSAAVGDAPPERGPHSGDPGAEPSPDSGVST